MKHFFLWIVFLLSLQSVYGQDTTIVKSRYFFIGVHFSPDYCYRTLTKNDNSLTNDQWTKTKKLLDSIYVPKLGYTAGFNFGYQINKRLSAEIGILYSNKGYKTIPILTVYYSNYDPIKATNITNYYYFNFPFKANYSFFKKRFQILTSVGLTLNLFRKSTIKSIPETPIAAFKTKTYVSTYEYNKINFSPIISVGIKYKISSKIYLRTEPTFQYGLLNIDKKSYASTHLWSAGLCIGFYIIL